MDRLSVLAETAGFFTRGDALREGHDDRSIGRAIRSRQWRRVRPGTYTLAELWPAIEEDLHRITAVAVEQKLRPNVALSHTSASLLHGQRVWNTDLSRVHLTRLDRGAGRTEAGVVHHEGFTSPSDVLDVEGTRVMHPARAAIESASLVPAESGLVILDSALQLGTCSGEELASTYELMQNWPGMRPVGLVVRMSNGGSQSVGESRSRHLFFAQGLPAPELQWKVLDSQGRLVGTTDFAWPEHGVLGEFDGKTKYGRLLREGETPGDAVFREKVREDLLREVTGWEFVRLVWADLYQPQATAHRVRRKLRICG